VPLSRLTRDARRVLSLLASGSNVGHGCDLLNNVFGTIDTENNAQPSEKVGWARAKSPVIGKRKYAEMGSSKPE
jgi:hypothetical protein